MYITLTNDDGSPCVCPLWKLPQFVSAELEKKKDAVQAAKAAEQAAQAAQVAEEQARRAEEIRAAEAINSPFDLTEAADV